MQHDRTVLADRIEHHGLLALRDDLAHDVDAFGFQALEVRQCRHSTPQSASTASASAPAFGGAVGGAGTVREKRGAGAFCSRPSTSTKALRARLCGCSAASASVSTGVTHASLPSNSAHQSARVLVLKMSSSSRFSA